ncbi:MAG: AarF/UbiB family protein, partial [Bacteroidota bacterium]
MQKPRLRARYLYILTFFARAILSFIYWELILPKIGLRSLARRTRSNRSRDLAIRFRSMAIRMGGVMIKVGQFLSSRLDVLPPEVTEELSGLQDEVPPEDFGAIRHLAEAELGAPLSQLFERFEPEPLAAASLGQVHRARLQAADAGSTGFQDIVVKIQRPFIDQLIEVDFSALHRVAGWIMHYKPI